MQLFCAPQNRCRLSIFYRQAGTATSVIINTPGGGNKKAQQAAWNNGGSAAPEELAAFNESGEAFSSLTLTQVLFDGDDFADPLTQNYLLVENNFT